MTSKLMIRIGFAVTLAGLAGCEREVSFSADVKPILDSYCLECHSSSAQGASASGFVVDSYESIMRGTSLGKVIVPGSSVSSTLYLVVAEKTAPEIQMPPHHQESLAEGRRYPLSDAKKDAIRAWIDQGAKDN